MKAKTFLAAAFLSIILSWNIFPQGEAAIPFLMLPVSPSSMAMGGTGTALPNDDPLAVLYNPAQLGFSSRTNNLSFIFYPAKVEWLKNLGFDIELNSYALNLGYDLKNEIGFPVSVGLGYSRAEMDFGTYYSPAGSFNSKDYYQAFSLGVGIDYCVQLSVGYTYKDVTSILSDRPTGSETGRASAEPGVYDYGILLNVPLIKLIDENFTFGETPVLKPNFNFSLGYARTNVGDFVHYIDPAQADPLPRTDRLGYGINFGLDLIDERININTINISFTVEAEDILVGVSWTGQDSLIRAKKEYQSTLSDLRFWKNVIEIEGDEKIVSRRGLMIDLFETLTIYDGHFSGRGYWDVRETSGIGIRAKGLFKLYAYWANDPVTDFLAEHLDIRYYDTDYFSGDEIFETNITGLSIHFQNITSLF
ncbi:MAG: hypothetical protein IPM56_12370 [Ignavibacteriales bacterium]|nr:MAG: hypothetical protein IPM56_12370 [Ignavibacteriales bacterium]